MYPYQKAPKAALGIPYETQHDPPNARSSHNQNVKLEVMGRTGQSNIDSLRFTPSDKVLSVIQTKVRSFNLWSGHRVAVGVLRDFCNPEKLKWVTLDANITMQTLFNGISLGLLCLSNLLSKLKVENACLNPRVMQKDPRLELDMSGDLHNAISLQEVWRPRFYDVPDDMNMTPTQRRELQRQRQIEEMEIEEQSEYDSDDELMEHQQEDDFRRWREHQQGRVVNERAVDDEWMHERLARDENRQEFGRRHARPERDRRSRNRRDAQQPVREFDSPEFLNAREEARARTRERLLQIQPTTTGQTGTPTTTSPQEARPQHRHQV
jgi:hypothetical protein